MDAKRKYAIKNKCPKGVWKAARAVYRKTAWWKCRAAMAFSSGNMTMYCPCCGTKIRKFVEGDYSGRGEFYDLSLFQNVRQDVLCPACGSLPRQRILAGWGDRHKGLLVGKDILFFAPERSMTKWLDDSGITYTTADLMDEDADLKLDIQKTGLPDNSYDVIMCNHVLEHVDDYHVALREMRRILRPGGVFILSFPVSQNVELVDEDPSVVTEEARLKRYGQSDHVRLFGRHAEQLLAEEGFDVELIDGKDYPENTLPVVGPGEYDIDRLYLCRVKDERADDAGSAAGAQAVVAVDGAAAGLEASREASPAAGDAVPDLSIVVPIYNVEKYLPKCVDSLLRTPGIEKAEILLIDDGSTDDSGKIAKEYASENDFVKYFRKRNGGLSDARNYGLKKACGKYVFFCDADDIVFPEGMEKVIVSSSESDADVILWNGAAIDENDKEITSDLDLILTHKGLPEDGKMITGTEAMILQIEEHNKAAMTAWLRACRRDFLLSNELFFEEGLIHEDELWTPQVMIAAGRVLFEKEKVYGYRVRENSIMNAEAQERKHAETMVYVMNKLSVLYTMRVPDKKQRKVLLRGRASDYLWAIGAYDVGKYRCRKLVPKYRIYSASRGLKMKIKSGVLVDFGVRSYCAIFGKRCRKTAGGGVRK